MSALLFFGEVMHSRLRPRLNRFRYPVFFVRFPVHRMQSLRAPLLSVDSWNLISVYRRDHGPRDGSDLCAWIRGLLAAHGIDRADGEVWLQTFPRVLGYVFNPVSFWLCHDRAGALRAVLCEVSNTFGERHTYLLAHEDQRPIEADHWLAARKAFHVSPFCEVRGGYRFQFSTSGGQCRMRIDYDDGEGMLLATAVRGTATPITTRALTRAFLRYPWMTVAVIVRIHWQALRLWRKGVPFFRKPLPPVQQTTR
jgi:DUF1365 family protein